MKFTIYVQDGCDYCKEIKIPDGIEVEQIYTNRDDYVGLRPHNVPLMQLKTIELHGPHQINEFLNIIADAKK